MDVSKPSLDGIKEMYDSGMSIKEIGAVKDRTPQTIFYHLKKMGVEIRHNGVSDEVLLKIKAKLDEGKTFKATAEELGLSRDTVHNVCQHRNWKPNNTTGTDTTSYAMTLMCEARHQKELDIEEKEYAENLKKITRVVVNGKAYQDVTDFFI